MKLGCYIAFNLFVCLPHICAGRANAQLIFVIFCLSAIFNLEYIKY